MFNTTTSLLPVNFSTSLFEVDINASTPMEGMDLSTENNGDSFADWPNLKNNSFANWGIILAVVLFGLVGNALAFLLMTGGQFSFLSYPVYLKWLAVSDTTLLLFKLIDETEKSFAVHHFIHNSDLICELYRYLRYTVFMLSPWLVVGLTMDRFVCVLFPLTRDRFCTRRKALVVCCVLAVLTATVTVPIPINVRIINGLCRAPKDVYYSFMVIRLILSSALPCLLILVLNIAIIVRIQRSATFRKMFTSRSNSNSSQQDKSMRPLVLVSVFAFITLLPLTVTECVEALLDATDDQTTLALAKELWPIFNIIYLMNFGQNFYILMASSSKYRKILATKIDCFRCVTPSENQGTMASMSTGFTMSVNSNAQSVETVS